MINGAVINGAAINGGLQSVDPGPVDPGTPPSGWDIGAIAGPGISAWAAQWGVWSLVITVDGEDISAQLVNVAPISIEAERIAARIAEFTVHLASAVDPNSWVGRAVLIDVSIGSEQTRLFAGVIVEPELDLVGMTLRCRCSDDIQRIVDGTTQAELLSLTDAYWSDDIFDRNASGWERLQDMLAVSPRAVWLDTAGQLRTDSLFPRDTPHGTLNENIILDSSLRVTLAQRANLINHVDIRLSTRFERMFQRNQQLTWTWPLDFCESRQYITKFLSKNMLFEAVENAGWRKLDALAGVVTETYEPLWPTDVYTCDSSPVIWNNLAPDQLIKGFTITAAKRWAQSLTHEFTISVTAPASIAAFGDLPQTINGSADFSIDVADWTEDPEADYSIIPDGFTPDTHGNRYRDHIDAGRLKTALDAMVAQAVQRINTSHMGSRVHCDLPIQPGIDLAHTLAIDTGHLSATGVVQRFQHSFDLLTSSAITTLELAFAAGQSSYTQPMQQWLAPTQPVEPPGPPLMPLEVPNHIGRGWSTQPWTADMWGWIVNRATPELIAGVAPEVDIVYEQEQLIIDFPAIDDTLTQHQTRQVTASIEIAVPHNPLVLT